MYPDEFGSIQVDQRQFIKPDYNDPNFNPITAPQYPPTKIQISVLDVVPAVWASEFVKPKQNSLKRKTVLVKLEQDRCIDRQVLWNDENEFTKFENGFCKPDSDILATELA